MPEGFAPPGTLVAGSVGRMELVKDPLNLVQAFIDLMEARPTLRETLRLVMVGEGGQRQKAIDLLRKAGCEYISWLPGDRDDVPLLMRAMNLFVLPSLAEGISNTILEAMASGLAVIATDVGGNSELVIDGQTGQLVAAGDSRAIAIALGRYVDAPHLIDVEGRVARKIAEDRYGIDLMVQRYHAVYDELLATKHRS